MRKTLTDRIGAHRQNDRTLSKDVEKFYDDLFPEIIRVLGELRNASELCCTVSQGISAHYYRFVPDWLPGLLDSLPRCARECAHLAERINAEVKPYWQVPLKTAAAAERQPSIVREPESISPDDAQKRIDCAREIAEAAEAQRARAIALQEMLTPES